MHTSERYGKLRCRPGYTLIEVLVVVMVVGIAGAIIVPQMLQAGTLGVQAAARMVVADIHYAQNDAVAHQKRRYVVFSPETDSYKLVDADGNKVDVQWRTGGGSQYAVDFRADQRFHGVTLVSADFDGEPVLGFDDLGAPDAGGRVVLEFNGQQYEVTVTAFTGRVTVERITPGG